MNMSTTLKFYSSLSPNLILWNISKFKDLLNAAIKTILNFYNGSRKYSIALAYPKMEIQFDKIVKEN